MIASIRWRLTLWYVGVLAAVLSAFALGVYGLMGRLLQERLDEGLRAVLDVAATSLAHDEAEGQDPPDAARSTVTELSSRRERLAIYDGQGRLLARSSRGPEIRLPQLPAAAESEDDATLATVPEPDDDDDDDQHRVAARRVHVLPRGTAYVIVASQPLDSVEDALETVREVLYWAFPAALLAAGVVGWFLARQSLAPMQAAFSQQRQFMADASHELRTPLSALQTSADVTLQRPHREEHEYREALGLVADQSRRLGRIVEEMFTLARADAGQLPVRREPLYLDETLADVARAARVLAEPRGVAVELAAAEEAPLVGDEDLLRRMALNLVDNAIKHSPPGGVVRLALERDAGGYRVTVADQGSGIPAEAHERIFERFFRLDAARVREGTGSGAGLGLAIARWVAEAHGGRLELVRSDSTGSLFRATLPAGAPA